MWSVATSLLSTSIFRASWLTRRWTNSSVAAFLTCSRRARCHWTFLSVISRPWCANRIARSSWSTPSGKLAVAPPCTRRRQPVSRCRRPAGPEPGVVSGARARAHAQRILDVLHTDCIDDRVFGEMLHVALGHVAAEGDHALCHIDLDVRGVDRVVQRQPLANVVTDALVGADVALRTDAAVPTGIARSRPAASFAVTRGRAIVATKTTVAGMPAFISVIAAEGAMPGMLPCAARLVARFEGTSPEIALIGKTAPVGIHAAELVARYVAFVKETHGRPPTR